MKIANRSDIMVRRLLGLAVVGSCLVASSVASAQIVGPADVGRVQPNLPQALPGLPSQAIEVRQAPVAEAPPGAENIKFSLEGITYDGLTVYTQAQLEKVYADRLGKAVSLADVYGIAAALTAKYRNDGYVLTQVVVPPQTIDGGVVRLQVVEGFVDTVTVEGVSSERERRLITGYAERVKGQPLNTRELERAVLLINDLPGVSVRGILSPSATVAGASDLSVIVERKPFNAEVGVDNFGSLYLGRLEGVVSASANSLLGFNERIASTMVYVPGHNLEKELAYGDLSYTQPLNSYGTKLEVSGALTSTNPGYTLAPLRVNGQSILISAKLSQPILRTRNYNWSVYTQLDWRHVNTQSNVDITRRDRISALRLGSRLDRLDTFLGGGFNTFTVEASQGLGIFASDNDAPSLSRAAGNPEFTKIEGEYQRLQRVTSKLNLLMGIKGQLANDALLSSEEFGVGGSIYGRGYDSSEILGDSGIAGKLELQLTNPVEIAHVRTYQLYSFLDGGRVWNRDATAAGDKRIDLLSTGAGLRVTLPSETKMGAYVALPLNRDVEAQGDQDPRVFFNLSQSF